MHNRTTQCTWTSPAPGRRTMLFGPTPSSTLNLAAQVPMLARRASTARARYNLPMDNYSSKHAEAAIDLLERFSEVSPPVDDPDDLRGQRQYLLAGAVVHALLDIAASLRDD